MIAPSTNVIELRGIGKTYPGVRALSTVDFSLKSGELHCLVGENGSGKSTLIKILSGVVQPEPGAEIVIDGRRMTGLQAHTAIEHGIRVIYQDLALFPNLSVGENIAFQLYGAMGSRFVRRTAMETAARAALAEIGLDIDPERRLASLSIAEQQLVEITRALVGTLKLLILDEPTSSLTRREVNALFAVILRLQGKGITTLFVSHKLNEVFEIAERVTVLRDGRKIGLYGPDELDHERLTFLMTGHRVQHLPPTQIGEERTLLEIRELSKAGNYRNISLRLLKGEILGITGLLGSGRSELARSIFGMNPPDSGAIHIDGREVKIGSPVRAQRLGIAYVPEHRLVEGLVMEQSIEDNIGITVWDRLLDRFGLLSSQRQRELARHWVRELDIKVGSPTATVQTLSGGNQQKVVLSKWLATDPRILILDEPTVGIDVFAKDSVHTLIKALAKQGIGVILISDEVQEVLNTCHRIVVMQRGVIVHEVRSDEHAEADLLRRFNLA